MSQTAQVVEPLQVVKRDGSVVPFDFGRIERAVSRCYAECESRPPHGAALDQVLEDLCYDLMDTFNRQVRPTVEQIQDIIEDRLVTVGYPEAAKRYILYREEHRKQRAERPIPEDVRAAFASAAHYFPTPLQQFQFFDKYSRFNEALGRRETWVETVDRCVDFLRELSANRLPSEIYERVRRGILEMRVMPSMRLLAMAGEPARRNGMALYNCLSRDTTFITNRGVASFEDFEDGDEVTVLAPSGAWRRAVVHHYGEGYLNRITLRRSSTIQQVKATPDHRWLLKDGRETEDLKRGDVLKPSTYPITSWRYEHASPQERLYWAYGFVYGDGTLVKSGATGQYTHSMVRLCGAKAKYAERFRELGFKTSSSASLHGDIMAYTGTYLKTLPDIGQDGVELVRAFVVGYLDADGAKSHGINASPYTSIQASKAESIEFIREIFPVVGAYITSERNLTGKETNYGVRGDTVQFYLLTGSGERGQCHYSVREIEESVEAGQLWCLEVEEEHAFVLPSGIVTGNCSYLACDDLAAFPEALLISMAGCGVGYSVESRYVDQLPSIAAVSVRGGPIHVIEDSAEGWADALRVGIDAWVHGREAFFDYSQIRPAGAILKTKGGRASGPEPLRKMLEFCRARIRARQGKRLRPIDVHDMMCMVGSAAVSGGVRRTAMISLFDYDDAEMLGAKAPGFDRDHPYRWNANNSMVWTDVERLDQATFIDRFMLMVRSSNGEPGIFSRQSARNSIPARRTPADFGTNPCVTADTWVLTDQGPRQVRELVGVPHRTIVHGQSFATTEEGFWSTGVKPVLRLKTREGHELRLTENHQIETVTYRTRKVERSAWREAGSLKPGDVVKLQTHRGDLVWESHGTFEEGRVLGLLVGDGTFSQKVGGAGQTLTMAHLDCWGEHAKVQMLDAASMLRVAVPARSDLQGGATVTPGKYRVQSAGLAKLADSYGIEPRNKTITPQVERASSAFYGGFLQGLFDADGSVQGTHEKGVSIRLAQSSLPTLQGVQRMLMRLGIAATIYADRRPTGTRVLPDGRGGTVEYECRADHELVIANDNIQEFAIRVGFGEPEKAGRLDLLIGSYRRKPNRETFTAVVDSIEPDGVEEVFDCSVPGPNCFDANGFVAHNCGEIILRPWQFCNLTAAIVRADDTLETLAEKVALATVIGTIQSLATNFPGLRPQWKQNCEEERLLGVDITGQQDNPLLLTAENLETLRAGAVLVNQATAQLLGINPSAAVTCVKPSGNTSQLVNCASGLHARWAPYYIRNVRVSATSPLAKVLKDAGVPMAPENGDDPLDPRAWVVSFPVKSPDGAVTRGDRTAVEQCEWWLRNKVHYTEHNPSVTITYRPDEVLDLMAWVWDHRHQIGGMAFLPAFDARYDQLPYIEISREEYERRVAEFPEIDFSKVYRYEIDDHTTAAQESACSAGLCEIEV